MPGDPVVPFDLWHLPFLRYGEGANTDTGASARSSRRRGARRSPTCRRCPIRRPRPGRLRPPRRPGRCAGRRAVCAGHRSPRPVWAAPGSMAPGRRAWAASPVVTRLAAPATVPAATAARAGLTISFAVPAGPTAAAIRVLATRGRGPLTVIAKQTVRVRRGVNKVALNGKALRRRLKRGKVVVEVRLKRAGGGVGAPKRTVVKIV